MQSQFQNGVAGTRVSYTSTQARGPLTLAVTSGVSLCAVVAILIVMAVSASRKRNDFMFSQVGAYFLSLVISDLLQAIGSVMNLKWVLTRGVTTGHFCTAQAALKQTGNVGTAIWSLIIAIHTFCLLFLRRRFGTLSFYLTLVGVWLFIFFIVIMGPLIIQDRAKGDFWGISGYWCWITAAYHAEQLTNEYLFMFITAGTSFILYTLILFRLRGNIEGSGRNLRFRKVEKPWVEDASDQCEMAIVGKQMLWYPAAYTILIVPIAVCRWSAIFGHNVPYWATISADAVFTLTGFVNAILYSTTRKIVPIRSLFSSCWACVRLRGKIYPRDEPPPYLADMEFATPRSPAAGVKSDIFRSSIISLDQSEPWGSGDVATPTSYNDSRELSNVCPSEAFQPCGIVNPHASHIATPEPAIFGPRRQTFPLDGNHSHTQTSRRVLSVGDYGSGNKKCAVSDAAQSFHREQFAGGYSPKDKAQADGFLDLESSISTDLDEMEFAPPSPAEPVRRLPIFAMRSSFSEMQNVQ